MAGGSDAAHSATGGELVSAWIALDTDRGPCYVDPDEFIGLGAPMINKARTFETRALMMRGGNYVAILNSAENMAAIRTESYRVPVDAHEQHAPLPAPKVKKAKAEKPEHKSPAPRGKKGTSNA